jgi:hypothetical protein
MKTKEQIELLEAAKPLIKYLNDNHNPHAKAIVECDCVEIVTGEIIATTEEFIKG